MTTPSMIDTRLLDVFSRLGQGPRTTEFARTLQWLHGLKVGAVVRLIDDAIKMEQVTLTDGHIYLLQSP